MREPRSFFSSSFLRSASLSAGANASSSRPSPAVAAALEDEHRGQSGREGKRSHSPSRASHGLRLAPAARPAPPGEPQRQLHRALVPLGAPPPRHVGGPCVTQPVLPSASPTSSTSSASGASAGGGLFYKTNYLLPRRGPPPTTGKKPCRSPRIELPTARRAARDVKLLYCGGAPPWPAMAAAWAPVTQPGGRFAGAALGGGGGARLCSAL